MGIDLPSGFPWGETIQLPDGWPVQAPFQIKGEDWIVAHPKTGQLGLVVLAKMFGKEFPCAMGMAADEYCASKPMLPPARLLGTGLELLIRAERVLRANIGPVICVGGSDLRLILGRNLHSIGYRVEGVTRSSDHLREAADLLDVLNPWCNSVTQRTKATITSLKAAAVDG